MKEEAEERAGIIIVDACSREDSLSRRKAKKRRAYSVGLLACSRELARKREAGVEGEYFKNPSASLLLFFTGRFGAGFFAPWRRNRISLVDSEWIRAFHW